MQFTMSTVRDALWRYGMAILSVVLVYWARRGLSQFLGTDSPLLLFVISIIISARFGGQGPGILATALSAFIGIYFFFDSSLSILALGSVGQTRALIFCAIGVTISVLCGKLRTFALESAQKERRFRLLVDGARDTAIFAVDNQARIQTWNSGAERVTGYSEAEIVGRSLSIFYAPEEKALGRPASSLERACNEGSVSETGWWLTKEGTRYWAETKIYAVSKNTQSCEYTFVVRDTTAEHAQRMALEHSEQRFHQLIDASVVGILISDGRQIIEANEYVLDLLGYVKEEIQENPLLVAKITAPGSHAADRTAFRQLQREGKCPAYEKEFLRKDGSRIPVLIGSIRLASEVEARYLSFVVDQTHRKRVEEQFRQAQKLESLGQLAGGVAHDFNNLLTIIKGYAEMTAEELDPSEPLHERMVDILDASNRAATLTRQLLTFSRRDVSEKKIVHLNTVIQDVERMLRRLIGEDIELVLALSEEELMIQVDPGHLEQVIVNLVVNARDAMPNGGRILIETEPFSVDDQFANDHLHVPPGEYVMLSVTDSGTGMSEEVRSHIFEPFFTTKEQGKGTGLGLATVYGIIKSSGGNISVYSELGTGTVFKILLPALQPDGEPLEAAPVEVMVHGTETILLAEDEPAVRKYVRQILQHYGYSVLEACDGVEAMQTAEQNKGRVHLLLTDIIMPKMGGFELTRQFKDLYPDIPVLQMSGYTDRIHSPDLLSNSYIQKPVAAIELLRRIREVLDLKPERAKLK